MITGQMIVDEARTWIGTPWKHQARVKGVGTDCLGLIVGTAVTLGLEHEDKAGYSRMPDGHSLQEVLERTLLPVQTKSPGDVLVFKGTHHPRHVAFYAGDGRMIHADFGVDKCVEITMNDRWLKRLVATYRFKEVAEHG